MTTHPRLLNVSLEWQRAPSASSSEDHHAQQIAGVWNNYDTPSVGEIRQAWCDRRRDEDVARLWGRPFDAFRLGAGAEDDAALETSPWVLSSPFNSDSAPMPPHCAETLRELPAYADLSAALGSPEPTAVRGRAGSGRKTLISLAARDKNTELLWLTPEWVWGQPEIDLETALADALREAASSNRTLVVDETCDLFSKHEMNTCKARACCLLLQALQTQSCRMLFVVADEYEGDLESSVRDALKRARRVKIDPSLPEACVRVYFESAALRGLMSSPEGKDLEKAVHVGKGHTLRELERARSGAATLDALEAELKRVSPRSLEELSSSLLSTATNISYADVAGQEDAKAALEEALVWPRTRSVEMTRLGLAAPRGVLLHGPPGTGKTMLAKAAAHESRIPFISLSVSDLIHGVVGESERAIARAFSAARAVAPCVLFFDEAQAVFMGRGGGAASGVASHVLAQLLSEMDDLKPGDGVTLLAATNQLDHIDASLLRAGRFDRVVYVGPCHTIREKLVVLRSLQAKPPGATGREEEELARFVEAELAQKEYTGAQLAQMWRLTQRDGEGSLYERLGRAKAIASAE